MSILDMVLLSIIFTVAHMNASIPAVRMAIPLLFHGPPAAQKPTEILQKSYTRPGGSGSGASPGCSLLVASASENRSPIAFSVCPQPGVLHMVKPSNAGILDNISDHTNGSTLSE